MIRSADEFAVLRTSEDPEEYRRAAHEPADEAVWLEVIARYPELRFDVAHNKTVPASILRVLARDADPRVRWMVARKRALPPDLWDVLAGDPDEGVRSSLACNRSARRPVLERLASDPAALVAARARERLDSGEHRP